MSPAGGAPAVAVLDRGAAPLSGGATDRLLTAGPIRGDDATDRLSSTAAAQPAKRLHAFSQNAAGEPTVLSRIDHTRIQSGERTARRS